MVPNPHDSMFKAVFGQPEHARGVLRTIAPAALAEALDWSTLALQPGSFVDAAFSHQHTDAIMTAGQRLIEQGRQQGIQQGAQGMLLRQLRQRFGDAVNAQVEQRIATASLEQIEVWAERVLSATTLAEVIAN